MKHLRIKTKLFQRAALSLLTFVMAFTAQTARADEEYGWYDISMSIGGSSINPSTWSGDPNDPTDLGTVSNMIFTNIAFKIWSNANDRGGANMFFRVYDDNGNQIGSDQDLHLGTATRITGDHDFSISYAGPYDLANAVGLTLVPGKTYYIDVWFKSYGPSGDQWYSNGGANFHSKLTIAHGSYSVTGKSSNNAYWATFYSEEGNYQASSGTQVFAVKLNTSTAEISMTEISDRIVKSGEGVVLKNTTTGSITMSRTETTPAGNFSNNTLSGTMTEITNPGNAYVLSSGTNGVGFYKLSNSGKIGANKAYLTYSGGNASAREYFLFDDEKTGIEMPTADGNDVDAVVYDLQGRRVKNPVKGLYIVNGKKVIIK